MNVVVKAIKNQKTTQLIIKRLFLIVLFIHVYSYDGFDLPSTTISKLYPYTFKYFDKYSSSSKKCELSGRPGDCNPESCGKYGRTCESRYTRFWDSRQQIDRTQKSCKCIQETICDLFGTSFTGCQSYAFLSNSAQTKIRQWTMSKAERQSRAKSRLRFLPSLNLNNNINKTNSIGENNSKFIGSRRGWTNQETSWIYLDKTRHDQLLLANTRYCCHTAAAGLSSGRPARRRFKTSPNSFPILKYNIHTIIIVFTSLFLF